MEHVKKQGRWYCNTCSHIATTLNEYKAHKATHPITGECHDPTAQPMSLIELPIVSVWQHATRLTVVKQKGAA
ncbi:hypothetical protein [Herpetosiphon sp. NSE202]|uniref:hypothetical protein n=1 Tax=Herpetosiphon sp. NSE202 TaxID=3351349 RepID=UPI003642F585